MKKKREIEITEVDFHDIKKRATDLFVNNTRKEIASDISKCYLQSVIEFINKKEIVDIEYDSEHNKIITEDRKVHR